MTTSTQGHLNARTGDIDFPLWAKVVGGILAVCTPIGLSLMGWVTLTVVEMKTDLKYATQDRYTATQHAAYAQAQLERDGRQNDRIMTLERTIEQLHARD